MDKSMSVGRRALLASSAGFALPPRARAQTPIEMLVLTDASKNLPATSVATCAELDKSAAKFLAEAKRAKEKPAEVAAELSTRVASQQQALSKAIADADIALENAKLDEAFAYINTGIAIGLGALAISFTGPIAVGLLAGGGVLVGPTSFTVQAYFRKGNNHVDFVTGYAKGRSLMFADMLAPAKSVRALGVSSVSYFVAAVEYRDALQNQDAAKKLAERSNRELDALNKSLAAMGKDQKAWAKLYEDIATAAHAGIKQFTDATRANNCILLQTAKGPMFVKP